MYQKAQQVQLILFPPTYFELAITFGEVGVKLSPSYFFLIENCHLLSTYILSNVKTFKLVRNTFWIWRDIFTGGHHISSISTGNLAFICFVWLQTLVLFFLCFSGFLRVSMSFLWEHFCLNIYYGNILLHFGLKGAKIYKKF